MKTVTTTRLWCFGVLVSLAAVFAGLSLTFVSRAVARADMPGCCYSPQNQYDLRCAGARFGWAPGTNTDDPGTWGPRYNPWDGDCQNYSGSAFHTAGYKTDPAPLRCKDMTGSFGFSQHVCEWPDHSVTYCKNPPPIFAPPCQTLYTQLAPGFWESSAKG